jgi:hypothetical protein
VLSGGDDLFQRPYELKPKNWETLWEDVLERYEASTESSHFMGAIVTMPSRSVPVGVAKHLIIDGQQRLTTLALLLCAVRDALPPDANERARIQKFYLTNDGYDGWDYLKLLPTQDDRDGFKALVNASAIPVHAEMQMQTAYRFFCQRIKEKDSDGNPIDVQKLLDTIERKLIIVNINLGENEDPYLIFESLNAKGSPLTQADLVRNYFLMRFPVGTQEDIYTNLWLPMQRRLGDNLTEFMRHCLMRNGEEVLKDDVYSQLKRRVQELVCAVPTNQLKRIFLEAAKGFVATNTLAWLRHNLSSGSAGRRWPPDKEFREAWLHYNVYSVPQRCKLILGALEKSYGHKEPAVLDAATIEHVMPQTLTEEWRDMLAADGDPDEIHDSLGGTIGNLTITAYNPELSNLEFQAKKKIYSSSHYSLNGWFATCPVWSIKQIEARANELWERAKEVWPAPDQTGQETDDPEPTNRSREGADDKLYEVKRELIIPTLSQREGINLVVKGARETTLYSSRDGKLRAVCVLSKRYPRGHPSGHAYWYQYTEEARRFLLEGQNSFVILGCLDQDSAYAIPSSASPGVLVSRPNISTKMKTASFFLKSFASSRRISNSVSRTALGALRAFVACSIAYRN